MKTMARKMTPVEFILEQVVMGTYKNGEDKICYQTLPKSMIDHALRMEEKMRLEFWNGGIDSTEEGGKSFDQYINENYGGGKR